MSFSVASRFKAPVFSMLYVWVHLMHRRCELYTSWSVPCGVEEMRKDRSMVIPAAVRRYETPPRALRPSLSALTAARGLASRAGLRRSCCRGCCLEEAGHRRARGAARASQGRFRGDRKKRASTGLAGGLPLRGVLPGRGALHLLYSVP